MILSFIILFDQTQSQLHESKMLSVLSMSPLPAGSVRWKQVLFPALHQLHSACPLPTFSRPRPAPDGMAPELAGDTQAQPKEQLIHSEVIPSLTKLPSTSGAGMTWLSFNYQPKMNPKRTQGQGTQMKMKVNKEGSESKHTPTPSPAGSACGRQPSLGPEEPSLNRDPSTHAQSPRRWSTWRALGADREGLWGQWVAAGPPAQEGQLGPGWLSTGDCQAKLVSGTGSLPAPNHTVERREKRHTAGKSKVSGLRPLYLKLLCDCSSRAGAPFPQQPGLPSTEPQAPQRPAKGRRQDAI